NFLLSESYLNDSAVLKKRRKPPVITQAEGVGGKMSMRLTTIKQLKVGPYRFRWVPTFLFKDEYNVTNYPFVGGLLGNDILRRFNITFNYAKQQVHIMPNLHFKDEFDYAYSGLSIYFIDEKIVVDDVVSGSPAEKAGFKKEDIIVAINNNTSNNIQAYKTIMQTLGQKLRFLVIRDGMPMMLSMKARSIL
ncbi:MAG: PDZ domain-containing protein, partial [Chitinophagaceae bacterium]|nr:PDZ domain-containing protein [Chitinophagaceae bacterium]